MNQLLLILMLVAPAHAEKVFKLPPRSNPKFAVPFYMKRYKMARPPRIDGDGITFFIDDSEKRDPAALREATLKAEDRTARRLLRRLKAGTIRPEEKDYLLRLLVIKAYGLED